MSRAFTAGQCDQQSPVCRDSLAAVLGLSSSASGAAPSALQRNLSSFLGTARKILRLARGYQNGMRLGRWFPSRAELCSAFLIAWRDRS